MNYNDFAGLINKRASHRKFLDEEVKTKDFEKIMEAARFAPSGHNMQPWQIVFVKKKDIITEMADTIEKRFNEIAADLSDDFAEKFQKYSFFATHFKDAPAVIAVFIRKDEYITTKLETKHGITLPGTKHFDMELLGAGGLIQSMLLSARTLGYETCWMTEPVVYAQKEIEQILDAPDGYNFVSLVAIGKPTKERSPAPKKSVEEITKIIE